MPVPLDDHHNDTISVNDAHLIYHRLLATLSPVERGAVSRMLPISDIDALAKDDVISMKKAIDFVSNRLSITPQECSTEIIEKLNPGVKLLPCDLPNYIKQNVLDRQVDIHMR